MPPSRRSGCLRSTWVDVLDVVAKIGSGLLGELSRRWPSPAGLRAVEDGGALALCLRARQPVFARGRARLRGGRRLPRVVAANLVPDHSAIAEFRVRHEAALTEVLRVCFGSAGRRAGVGRGGRDRWNEDSGERLREANRGMSRSRARSSRRRLSRTAARMSSTVRRARCAAGATANERGAARRAAGGKGKGLCLSVGDAVRGGEAARARASDSGKGMSSKISGGSVLAQPGLL
jgi:hypothetical protein